MHDRNGNPLSIGDDVIIPCKIKSCTLDEDYCNVTLVAKYPMPPYEFDHTITLNSKQLYKVDKDTTEIVNGPGPVIDWDKPMGEVPE